MEQIKRHWKDIVLVVFVIFGMTKCTSSCNKGIENETLQKTFDDVTYQYDSIVKAQSYVIDSLEYEIKFRDERLIGLKQSLDIKSDAMRQISESKKNIQVTVKTQEKQ